MLMYMILSQVLMVGIVVAFVWYLTRRAMREMTQVTEEAIREARALDEEAARLRQELTAEPVAPEPPEPTGLARAGD